MDNPKPKALAQGTKDRIQRIRNGLVLQVALRAGQFWEEVRETRTSWDIDVRKQLPPEPPGLLYPERLLSPNTEAGQYILDSHRWEVDIERLWLWLAVPRLQRYRLELDWAPLMSALVLFQPPLEALQDFAKYGGIVRKDPLAKYKRIQRDFEQQLEDAAIRHDPTLVSPLIRKLQHPYPVERAWRDYYETLMEEINERFLKPKGLDIQEMKEEVLKDGRLDDSLQERLRRISQDLYVQVPQGISVDELREAVGIAASMREQPKGAAKAAEASNTILIQVELAYRYYHLRQDFLNDVIRQRYPNVTSPKTFKRYVSEGRRVLSNASREDE